jgi:hypothetical protein
MKIDKSIDVEKDDPGFSPSEFNGARHNGKAAFDGNLAHEELGITRSVDIGGNPITSPPASAVRSLKTDAARDATNRRSEWLLGAWSGGGLLYRALADLLGTGVLEFSETSMRAIAKKYGVDQSNLSKVCAQWEKFFGVEIGHCKHGNNTPDPLAKLKKGKKKYQCRPCYSEFWESAEVKPEDVICPKCKNHVNALAMHCEDCAMEFLAPKSNPACPRCAKPGRKIKNPDAENAEVEENEIDGNDESQQHAE